MTSSFRSLRSLEFLSALKHYEELHLHSFGSGWPCRGSAGCISTMYAQKECFICCVDANSSEGGGKGYTGSAACVSGYTCHVYNDYYSQCIPAAQNQAPAPTTTTRAPSPHTTTTPKAQTTTKPTTKATSKPTTTAPAASPSPPSSGGSGKVQYAGIVSKTHDMINETAC